MPARGLSNNVKAGAFVILAIGGAFAVVVTLAGLRESLKPRNPYVLRFDLQTGASGLEKGSIVKVGGQPVGRVEGIRLVTEPGEESPGVYADIRVDRKITFYGEPVGFLERPLLGSGAEINFPGVRAGGGDLPEVAAGTTLRGSIAPPSFLAAAGYGDEQASQLQRVLARADTITENFQTFSTDARDVVADVRERSPKWFDDADAITTRVREATDQFPEIASDVRARLDELKGLFDKGRAMLDENRPHIDEIVENVRLASEDVKGLAADLNSRIKDQLEGLLTDGRGAVADARDSLDRVRALIIEQTPNLRRSIANARLASDQLKLALGEIRETPWRLLYRPDTRELEFEYLYDAARTYASAVSDLRAASESLQASVGPEAAGNAASAESVPALVDILTRAFEQYEEAERRLLRMIIETPQGAAEPATSRPEQGR